MCRGAGPSGEDRPDDHEGDRCRSEGDDGRGEGSSRSEARRARCALAVCRGVGRAGRSDVVAGVGGAPCLAAVHLGSRSGEHRHRERVQVGLAVKLVQRHIKVVLQTPQRGADALRRHGPSPSPATCAWRSEAELAELLDALAGEHGEGSTEAGLDASGTLVQLRSALSSAGVAQTLATESLTALGDVGEVRIHGVHHKTSQTLH